MKLSLMIILGGCLFLGHCLSFAQSIRDETASLSTGGSLRRLIIEEKVRPNGPPYCHSFRAVIEDQCSNALHIWKPFLP